MSRRGLHPCRFEQTDIFLKIQLYVFPAQKFPADEKGQVTRYDIHMYLTYVHPFNPLPIVGFNFVPRAERVGVRR